ncbi:molybdenum cofactor biosynthesis protein B [Bacillus sp. N9]
MSVNEHKREAPDTINCAIITVSDTRTEATDKSGRLIRQYVKAAGYTVKQQQIVKDDRELIRSAVESLGKETDIQAILITGGTGISERDVTIESVSPLFHKEIVGFGELFRMLSYTEDIGSAAMMSRAAAGTYGQKVIFIMPGSSGAVKLAMEKLIMKELGHLIRELTK